MENVWDYIVSQRKGFLDISSEHDTSIVCLDDDEENIKGWKFPTNNYEIFRSSVVKYLYDAKQIVDICEMFRMVNIEEVARTLVKIGMGPVLIDVKNCKFMQIREECKRWIAISYIQSDEDDQIIFEGVGEYAGKKLRMQRNVYDTLSECIYTHQQTRTYSKNGHIAIWWDELPGIVSPACNIVWPALANLHYVSQPVVSVIPTPTDDVGMAIKLSKSMYRVWPTMERACAEISQGYYMLDQTIVLLSSMIIMLMLMVVQKSRDDSNVAETMADVKIKRRGISLLWDATIPYAFNIDLVDEHKIYGGKQCMQTLVNITNVIAKARVIYSMRKDIVQQIRLSTSSLIGCYVENIDGAVHAIDQMIGTIHGINRSKVDEYGNIISVSTTRTHFELMSSQAIAGTLMFGQLAFGDVYDQGDKLVAVAVLSNIMQASELAVRWYSLERETYKHPLKEIIYHDPVVWHVAENQGPTICWAYDKYSDHWNWPGMWTSRVPKGAVERTLDILGYKNIESDIWYSHVRRNVSNRIVCIAKVLTVKDIYMNDNKPCAYTSRLAYVWSTANALTIMPTKTAYTFSRDMYGVVIPEHCTNVQFGVCAVVEWSLSMKPNADMNSLGVCIGGKQEVMRREGICDSAIVYELTDFGPNNVDNSDSSFMIIDKGSDWGSTSAIESVILQLQ